MNIDNVYVGIPDKLINSVFWVNSEFRLNDLSFNYGGTDIIVEYSNGKVYGYDWVKFPSNYIKTIFKKSFKFEEYNELECLKREVKSIYAYINDKNDKTKKFEEVWNLNSNELPYERLKLYTYNLYENYINFFLSNIDFANKYISMHYPFKYSIISNNWNIIDTGSAYYSELMVSLDFVYPSSFGLSYNTNIKWNSKLRAKYEYGIVDMHMGYISGTGGEPVEVDDRDYLDYILPLNVDQELEIRSSLLINSMDAESFVRPKLWDTIDILKKEITFLDFKDFNKLYDSDKLNVLLNKSIWINTMSKIIDENFCNIIFEELNKKL